MAKVYVWGKYRDVDSSFFECPHEDVAYLINGRRYKMILCHIDNGILRGYNTHKKKWFSLFENYVQMDGSIPVGATLIDGYF